MREIAFIKQNKEKWLGIEQVILGKIKKNPDELSSLYINLINDLSFAQTYYPKSNTTVYLNHLSASIYQKIYKTKRVENNRFTYFFKEEVPLLLYNYRRFLLYAMSFFILFTCIGVISAHYNKDFLKNVIPDGESYINETIENIKKGNAVAIYKSGSNWGSTIGITFNNLMVGARMYISGIFGGLGSIHDLMRNSIMLGSFQYFFHHYGKLSESMRGIWLHGVFEIFSMIIETMAGLILGASVLFPKTYSRLESLKIGFRYSFKIFLSTVPFTITAGLIEGYITRYALEMPLFLNLTIIFGCLSIVIFYFIIYPVMVFRRKKTQEFNPNHTL